MIDQLIQEARRLLFAEGEGVQAPKFFSDSNWVPSRVGSEADLLIYLESLLSEGQCQRAIDIALYFPDSRCTRVIAALVPSHPQAGKATLLNRVLHVDNGRSPDEVFAALIPQLPESVRYEALRAVLAAVPTIREDWEVKVLLALAPYLSQALMLSEGLAAAHAIPRARVRAKALIGLLPLLPETLQPDIVAEALLEVRRIDDSNHYHSEVAECLVKLLPFVPDTNLPQVVTEALIAARKVPGDRGLGIGLLDRPRRLWALLPYLRGPERREVAMEAAAEVQELMKTEIKSHWQGDWCMLLKDLFPYLPKQMKHEVIKAARAVTYPTDRAWGLTALLPVLPRAVQRKFAEEALEAVLEHTVEPFWISTAPLVILLPYLPIRRRRETVLKALPEPRFFKYGTVSNIQVLAELLPYLSEADRLQYLTEALRTLPQLENEHERMKGLALLVPYLPKPLKQPMLYQVLTVIQTFEQEKLWAEALATVEERMSEAEGHGLVVPFSPREHRIPGVSPSYLRHIMRQIAELDRVHLLEELLDRIEAPYIQSKNLFGFTGQRDLPSEPASQERVVNTGFASSYDPETPLDRDMPLASSQPYYFWLQVGPPLLHSIEMIPRSLPTKLLPASAQLTVALFTATGDIELSPGTDVGELQLQADGAVQVINQPIYPPQLLPTSDVLKQRLFFPFRTPATEGHCSLLCNIYYERILVQSRQISIQVRHQQQRETGAQQSTLVYSLSQRIDSDDLSRIEPHRLSLQLNDNQDGTHSFAFFGLRDEELFKHVATFSEGALQNLIDDVRKGLRQTAWGDEEPWTEGKPYRYEREPDLDQLRKDLVRLAIKGWRLYYHLNLHLAGGHENLTLLMELMRQPGLVLIANRAAQNCILPASLIYDYKFDTNAGPLEEYALCPAFLEALDADSSLEELCCFKGDCPSRGKRTTVCPSGFWGYRHMLGLPPSTTEPPVLYYHDPFQLFVGVSTDRRFIAREEHEQALQKLYQPTTWIYAKTRNEALNLLNTSRPHLVYFYCHGGWDKDEKIPYLQVGPTTEYGITPDNLGWPDIYWKNPRPLVFINGCHTVALEPEKALEFVSAFVGHANACGVIGTEITVFEPLACRFAEECLRRFLVERTSIGQAVRGARLALLKERNPLGLVYTPFVLASLCLQQRAERTLDPGRVSFR